MLLGTLMSMMPGGAPLMDEAYSNGKLPPRTPDQQLGIAIGELLGGTVQVIGSIGLFGGGAVVTTTGVGAIVGAPAMALSAGLATTGALNIWSGVRNLTGALNAMSSGGGSGVSQGPAAPQKGVVYERGNRTTNEKYIGQSKSPERFKARQGEHDRAHGVKHSYDVIGKAKPGKDLDVLEESMIRPNGGLQKEGGSLVNKRHQMSEPRYRAGGGKVDDPNK